MFKFIVDGKEITDTRIQWKFAGTDLEFRSDPERLDRNIQHWRAKYKIGSDVEIQFLNVKKVEEDVKPIIAETAIESSVESIDVIDHSVVIEEPVVSQDIANTTDTPKRKTRKKTV